MRRYQQRRVNRLAAIYNSKDPLRWVNLAIVMGVDRPLTAREKRIFIRRFIRGMKSIGRAVGETIAAVVTTTTRAIKGLVGYFETIKATNPATIKLQLPLTLPLLRDYEAEAKERAATNFFWTGDPFKDPPFPLVPPVGIKVGVADQLHIDQVRLQHSINLTNRNIL